MMIIMIILITVIIIEIMLMMIKIILTIVVIMIINSLFQPGDFSTGSTSEYAYLESIQLSPANFYGFL